MEYSSLEYASLGIILLIVWSFEYWSLFKKPILVLPKKIKKTHTNILRLGNYALGVLGILLISYAMTGPRKPLKHLPGNIEVNDVFLVVDVSRSMLADDLRPNRLEVAKQKLRDFASLRPTDRLGVIIFSERVYTMLPLTTDPHLIDQVLSDIRIGFLGSGTNIGDALALAVGRAQNSDTKNKVIVLLTDGVNNVGNLTPMQAAEMAKDFNIKVYTIGLGTHKNARLPIGKDSFGQQQYQAIPGGSIDLKTLQDISDLTGGKSYLAETEGNLSEILEEIQKLEKTKILNQSQVVYDELFFIYLFWGGICFVFSEGIRRFVLREVA
ncbi:MAG: aerotolerance regulator BatA [Halobacteriovoraceae bacterium]|nr:aerotolerance regulator BatA [Halobacteriovoraceae bacterium]|tara:strand:- start:3821 stop:4795 length:975 start_codon:yes stop_codon:yes gene_type:complete